MAVGNSKMTRRAFLGGAGVLGASVASFGLAGCSSPKSTAEKVATSSSSSSEYSYQKPNSTVDADVAVVGSGMGGLCAALEAADNGASVALVEVGGELGGATNYAEGLFGAGTKMQAELGITDVDPSSLLKVEYDFQHYKVDTKRWKKLASASADNIDWLMNNGVKFVGVFGMGDTLKCWHVYEGWHGKSAVGYLTEALNKRGVAIHTNCRATSLITDNGKVTGVQAKSTDGYIDFKAKSVVLACGGFCANDEMMAELTDWSRKDYKLLGIANAQGDGVRMVRELTGEKPKDVTPMIIGVGVPEFGLTVQLGVAGAMEATNLWVNEDGERFVYESISRSPSVCGNPLRCQNSKTFSFFDQKAYDRFKTEGLRTGYGMYVQPGTVCDHIDQDAEDYKDNSYWTKANTIAELAQHFGINPNKLEETFKSYNDMCAAGVDTEWGKPAEYLIPIDQGPYYGFEIQPMMLDTMGGIRVDDSCRVCNKDMEPVEGLYAASGDISGFQGETYGVTISGSCQAISCWGGRIAGRNAAEYAK